MTPERLREIEMLFHEARERTPAERDAFLARACAHDSTLRREVESLLAEPPVGMIDAPLGALVAELVAPPVPRLAPGSSVGPYRIERLLAVGGMGEVYRARDTILGRGVAIKILPRHFTADPERLARFEREARMLAALNHPNIGAIYGLEAAAGGVRALVLELVEGETVADRIQRGPMPVTDALTIACQIADALDAAHEKGIIHRDLKPANIKVTPGGVVKVLDLGLAKAATGELQSPMVTEGGTQEGSILGTAAYMSPEQARGQAVDKRTDIWAFGCVLYEMLTRHLAFQGETVSDTIVASLEREPDWAALPATTPPMVARLLQRCLEKDPKRRLRDIADARAELDDALSGKAPAMGLGHPAVGAAQSRWGRWSAIVLIALASALAGWAVRRLNPAPDNPLSNATFTRLTNFEGDEAQAALSPDGKFAAFLSDRDGPLDVWLTQVGSGGFLNLTRKSHMPTVRPTRNIGFSGLSWLTGRLKWCGPPMARGWCITPTPRETRCSSRIVPASAPNRFLSIRLWEDTTIIRHGLPMVDGFTLHAAFKTRGKWTCGGLQPTAGNRNVSLITTRMWVSRHRLTIVTSFTSRRIMRARAHGCGRSIQTAERRAVSRTEPSSTCRLPAAPTIVVLWRRWPIQLRACGPCRFWITLRRMETRNR